LESWNSFPICDKKWSTTPKIPKDLPYEKKCWRVFFKFFSLDIIQKFIWRIYSKVVGGYWNKSLPISPIFFIKKRGEKWEEDKKRGIRKDVNIHGNEIEDMGDTEPFDVV